MTADLNVSVVGAFPTWIVSEFQTDGPEGGVARSPHVLHLHGGSFRRQMSILGWSGREGEYSFRRSGRFAGVGGGDGVETGACIFGELEQWLQPVKLTEYWCDVHSWSYTDYRTGCAVWLLLDGKRTRKLYSPRDDERR